jgi:uncharacterized FlaG/YvyC family protein
MIEQVLIELTEAIKANTAALNALKAEGAVATTTTTVVAEKAEKAEKPAKAPKAEKPAPKKEEPKIDREAIRKLIVDERARLTEQVSPAAAAKHKELTRSIVSNAGGTSITDIPESNLAEVFAAIKSIDVNAGEDDDDDL